MTQRTGPAAFVFAAFLGGLAAFSAGFASAADVAMDPGQKAVRGSCSESYLPIFAAAREVRFDGDYARLALSVAVTRDAETGAVTEVDVKVRQVNNLPQPAVDAVVAGVRAAYLQPEIKDCAGVISDRLAWVLRFGEPAALAAPDDPLVINRATAATRLRQRNGAVELMDPATGSPRVTRVPTLGEGAPQRCYASEVWRDFGPPPPIELMEKGQRFRVRFLINSDGRTTQVEVVNLMGDTPPSPELRAAAEEFVTRARFYPPIAENCSTRNAVASLVIGRSY